METYRFEPMADMTFATHWAVYAGGNPYMAWDWQELLDDCAPDGCGTLVRRGSVPIGGFAMEGRHIRTPFLVPPFADTDTFWQAVIAWGAQREGPGPLMMDQVMEAHAAALRRLGACTGRTQHRMARPTAAYTADPGPGYTFAPPLPADRDEIVRVVWDAHCHGYTAQVLGPPELPAIAQAIDRRYAAFTQTDTLSWGTLVREKSSGDLVAVCIAGIYPDSLHRFSTIHQVSVLPDHRRRGLARAMILNTLNNAHDSSPVIGLGVMTGNPAQQLYEQLGFAAGPTYADLILTVE